MPDMSIYTHPRLEDVTLSTALHALSDPVRLGIVRRLAGECELSCANSACPAVPKSTLSNHFKVLRSAGPLRPRPPGRALPGGPEEHAQQPLQGAALRRPHPHPPLRPRIPQRAAARGV